MITFGRFSIDNDGISDKELFLSSLNFFVHGLTGFRYHKTFSETEMIEYIKETMKNQKSSFFSKRNVECFSYFLQMMGLSYNTLTSKEKEEILVMDFTYENWEKKSSNIIENYLQRSKNACPSIIRFCFEDICFVFHAQIVYGCEFTLKNFVTFIRDYFILDKTKEFLKKYRDAKIYENIKKIVINLYPSLKQNYGINRYFEKILSYILNDTDYNYEKTKIILDNFYNKRINNNIKDDETIKFKDN